MNKKFLYIVEAVVALAVGLGAYAIVVGPSSLATPAQARPAEMPSNPVILYLAPQGAVRAWINDKSMRAEGATPVRDWQSARAAATNRSLDAMLIGASLVNTMTSSDVDWLQAQFRDGVTIVGLGVDDNQFAHILGLDTLRAPTEASVPIGPSAYRLVQSLALGNPDDLRTLGNTDWIDRMIRGMQAEIAPGKIKYPLVSSFSESQGQLNSQRDLDGLFFRIRSTIQNAYQKRGELQQMMKNFKEK